MAAWLNFANGAVKLDTPVATNLDGIDDSTFGAVMLTAETVRTDPASTSAQIKAHKNIIERIITQSARRAGATKPRAEASRCGME